MGEFGAWLNEHWPEMVSALAAVATLLVVLWDRWRPKEAAVDATIKVHRNKQYGALLAELMIARPAFGFLEIDEVSVPGYRVEVRRLTGGYDPDVIPPDVGEAAIHPRWMVDMHGQHQVTLFWFWVLEPSKASGARSLLRSMRPQNVLRVRLSITHKAAKTLRSKITITSNRIA